jgi:tetratricopeptide (TPR) repeat protein
MAKQRRPQPKSPAHRSADAPAARPETGPSPAAGGPSAAGGGIPRRTTYIEAVALYERALQALQRHEYREAEELLTGVLNQYPEERELQERAKLYLNICQRHAAPRVAAPQTLEERLYASTLAVNGGRYDEAISHLRLVRDEDPDNDHALYMLAVSHAQRGEHAEAIAHLERAIALNPENRALARSDPDLEPLRGDEAFRIALDTPSLPRNDPRRAFRTRTAR